MTRASGMRVSLGTLMIISASLLYIVYGLCARRVLTHVREQIHGREGGMEYYGVRRRV